MDWNNHDLSRVNTNGDMYPNWANPQPNAGMPNIMAHDANTETHNGPEFYSNEPKETESMPNAHSLNDKFFDYLNLPMEIDTPSGVSHNFNQQINEANTPKEIAALKKRVHQKVLDGNKRWAVPALPRPCPKVTENVKTHEVELSDPAILKN
ncbi:hypothetical protein DSO57_1018372 [Entomophthora muscae]|uniref:Uncharacterized protein n=1 Tax=Entomophthora muscae TaxID=34485 RepID=A0ACC2T557_9FUNG|nr:hypothetical protein DSO57_1018372 [Entomophthora muscae]